MNNAQWEMSCYLQLLQLTKYVIHCLFPHTYACYVCMYAHNSLIYFFT